MKRWSATLLVFGVCSAVVHADVTIVQQTTLEGVAAALAGAGVTPPTITIRIKGMKGRTDLDTGSTGPLVANVSTIVDAAAREVIFLDHNQKTARVSTLEAKPLAPLGSASIQLEGARAVDPKVNALKRTGKSKTIDGLTCFEYTFTTSATLFAYGSLGEMPAVTAAGRRRAERVIGPDLAAAGFVEEARKDTMVTKGTVWFSKDAPGAAEYHEYEKALTSADLPSVPVGAGTLTMPGSEKLTKAMQGVDGLPVLTVIGMSIEGPDGMTEIERTLGGTKLTTKVLSVKTDAIGDDVFRVPEGYRIIQ